MSNVFNKIFNYFSNDSSNQDSLYLDNLINKIKNLGKSSRGEFSTLITNLSISMMILKELDTNPIVKKYPEIGRQYIAAIFRMFDTDLMIALDISINKFMNNCYIEEISNKISNKIIKTEPDRYSIELKFLIYCIKKIYHEKYILNQTDDKTVMEDIIAKYPVKNFSEIYCHEYLEHINLSDKIDKLFKTKHFEKNNENWKDIIHFLRIVHNGSAHNITFLSMCDRNHINKIIDFNMIKFVKIENNKIRRELDYFPEVIDIINKFTSYIY